MSRRWDPQKGRWTMRKLTKEMVKEAGPYGIPIGDLVSDLRKKGYYIPDMKYMIDMLPSLTLILDPDGEAVHLK